MLKITLRRGFDVPRKEVVKLNGAKRLCLRLLGAQTERLKLEATPSLSRGNSTEWFAAHVNIR